MSQEDHPEYGLDNGPARVHSSVQRAVQPSEKRYYSLRQYINSWHLLGCKRHQCRLLQFKQLPQTPSPNLEQAQYSSTWADKQQEPSYHRHHHHNIGQ